MRTTYITKGTDLFHGTNSETIYEFPEPPAWFSSSFTVAQYFANFHRQDGEPRVHLFRARRRIPKLLLIEKTGQYEELMEKLTEETGEQTQDPRVLSRYLCQKGYNGWIIPDNYPDGDDIVLCAPRDWLEWRGEQAVPRKERS